MTTQKHIVLLTGGTGGHIFPAQALASELQKLGHKLHIFTDQRANTFPTTGTQFSYEYIYTSRISGANPLKILTASIKIIKGFLQARRILKQLTPDAVVSFGGYAPLPAILAAQSLGVPTLLHEQNAVLGRANRLSAYLTNRICLSYQTTQKIPKKAAHIVKLTGTPVRDAFQHARLTPYKALTESDPVNLLVIGGSQGARILSVILPQAIAALPPEIRARLSITQQCRPEDLDSVKAQYDTLNVKAELQSFIQNIAECIEKSHLIISRAGASSISEITCVGRPSILVPYPFAINDHQTANGATLAETGGATLIANNMFTPERLSETLKALITTPDCLAEMAAAAREFGKPNATDALTQEVMNLTLAPNTERNSLC